MKNKWIDQTRKGYPVWVCCECALKGRNNHGKNLVMTWHMGICGVCKRKVAVTEPRDFGYPEFKIKEN